MKILLTLIMCSITTGECIAPYTHDKEYPDMYECLLDGYDMAADKTLENNFSYFFLSHHLQG